MWQTRHLMLFLFVFVSVVFLFLLLKKALGHWGYGLIGAFLYWMSPRFFAESFYNVKDVGFLAAFIIGLYFLLLFIERPNSARSALIGAISAFAAAVRILGGVFTLFAFAFNVGKALRRAISVKSFFLNVIVLGISFSLFLVLFYPASWTNPFRFFPEALAQMSHYPWNGQVLFLGKILRATELPWYYLPVWIFVSTPLPVILLFLVGLAFGGFCSRSVDNPPANDYGRALWLISVLLVIGSLILVVALRPTLYDGWRHFYFLYGPIVSLAVIGVRQIWLFLCKSCKMANGVRLSASLLALALLMSPVCYWMVENHPFEYVYFNIVGRENEVSNFERDYWGVSELKGLEYLLKNDNGKRIKLLNEGPILQISEMLPEVDRERIDWVAKPEDAEYRVSTFRTMPTDQPTGKEIYRVMVDGHRILSVVKND
jgi:hypothetical protein